MLPSPSQPPGREGSNAHTRTRTSGTNTTAGWNQDWHGWKRGSVVMKPTPLPPPGRGGNDTCSVKHHGRLELVAACMEELHPLSLGETHLAGENQVERNLVVKHHYKLEVVLLAAMGVLHSGSRTLLLICHLEVPGWNNIRRLKCVA